MLALCSVVLMTYFAQNYAGIIFSCLVTQGEVKPIDSAVTAATAGQNFDSSFALLDR